jgi:hypothetical protein
MVPAWLDSCRPLGFREPRSTSGPSSEAQGLERPCVLVAGDRTGSGNFQQALPLTYETNPVGQVVSVCGPGVGCSGQCLGIGCSGV